MLRSILNRAMSGRRAAAPGTRRPTRTPAGTAGGSANREIARGASSLLRGLGRKRKGL